MNESILREDKCLLIKIALLAMVFFLGIVSVPKTTFAEPVCGNNITEPGEACDGTDLNGYTCSSVAAGFKSGTLSCKSDCSGYDVSQCVVGDTVYAASCEQVDVQEAIDAAQDGDTVLVPAGTCTWTTPVCIAGSNPCTAVHIINKSLFLKGAGIGNTNIISQIPYQWNYGLFHIKNDEGKPARISGFNVSNITSRAVFVEGTINNWRLDHSKFEVPPELFGGYRYIIYAHAYGVIDNCIFNNSLVYVHGDENAAWERPLSLGTANAVYVEDSTFYYGAEHGQLDDFTDCEGGARLVVRHNNITNGEIHCHGTDGGALRGTHSYEYYKNDFIDDGTVNNYRFASLRGGTGVVYENTLFGNWGAFRVIHQRVCRSDLIPNCESYPCTDQIGRTTDHDDDGIQDLIPLFEWGNNENGQDIDIGVDDTYCSHYFGSSKLMSDYVKENRDYYNDAVSYNPSTKTYEASYTDDDGSTKQWSYTPYVYPHPLTLIDAETTLTGDLNSDNQINIQDIQACVNHILGMQDWGSAADVNEDSVVNVLDVQEIVNIILAE